NRVFRQRNLFPGNYRVGTESFLQRHLCSAGLGKQFRDPGFFRQCLKWLGLGISGGHGCTIGAAQRDSPLECEHIAEAGGLQHLPRWAIRGTLRQDQYRFGPEHDLCRHERPKRCYLLLRRDRGGLSRTGKRLLEPDKSRDSLRGIYVASKLRRRDAIAELRGGDAITKRSS